MPDMSRYKKKAITIYLEPWQCQAIEYINDEVGIPKAEIIRRGLTREIERYEVPESIKNAENEA